MNRKAMYLEFFFGWLCVGLMLYGGLLAILDKGGQILQDGYPLTPPWEYGLIIISIIISFTASGIAGTLKQKTEETEKEAISRIFSGNRIYPLL